jgi:hypothetical protein
MIAIPLQMEITVFRGAAATAFKVVMISFIVNGYGETFACFVIASDTSQL